MDNQTHMVQKTLLEVKLHNRNSALKQQQDIAILFKERLMPVISSVFDSLVTKEQTIRIDTLDIKLGTIDLNDQDTVIENFKQIFRQELSVHIQDSNIQTLNTSVYIFKQFLSTLKTGVFTWNSKFKNFEQLMNALLETKWSKPWFNEFLLQLLNSKNSFKRLLFQSSNSFLERVKAEMITYYKISESKTNEYKIKFKDESHRDHLELFLAIILFEYTSNYNEKQGISNVIESIKEEVHTSTDTKTKSENESKIKLLDEDTLIPIANAGLVLLNPIIPTLFERCNLLKNNTFIDIQSQEKGIFILHYLASGSLKLDESNSVLYKILCGVDIDHPIPSTFKLNRKILDLCNEALLTIIHEWKALKNTSIEGLRENFIKREGNLKTIGDSYTLDVYQESVDVILNYSPPPWTVGMIRFPWMDKMLNVNWF